MFVSHSINFRRSRSPPAAPTLPNHTPQPSSEEIAHLARDVGIERRRRDMMESERERIRLPALPLSLLVCRCRHRRLLILHALLAAFTFHHSSTDAMNCFFFSCYLCVGRPLLRQPPTPLLLLLGLQSSPSPITIQLTHPHHRGPRPHV